MTGEGRPRKYYLASTFIAENVTHDDVEGFQNCISAAIGQMFRPMIRIDEDIRKRGLKSRMTLQVHDELVFEVPENEVDVMKPLVRERMENAHTLAVPLVVEIGVGKNWRDME